VRKYRKVVRIFTSKFGSLNALFFALRPEADCHARNRRACWRWRGDDALGPREWTDVLDESEGSGRQPLVMRGPS
jgi:hypothetical protein